MRRLLVVLAVMSLACYSKVDRALLHAHRPVKFTLVERAPGNGSAACAVPGSEAGTNSPWPTLIQGELPKPIYACINSNLYLLEQVGEEY